MISFLNRHQKELLNHIYDLHCPYDCGAEWQFATTVTTNQVIKTTCEKCRKTYSVKVHPSEECDVVEYIMEG